MKKVLSVTLFVTCIILACKSANNQTTTAQVIMKDSLPLNGTWQLEAMPGNSSSLEALFPRKIPVLSFEVSAQKVSGHTGCNSFSGKLVTEGVNIRFAEPIAMTKMFCPGNGETIFLKNLQMITAYSITNDTTLNLLAGDSTVMRLRKKIK